MDKSENEKINTSEEKKLIRETVLSKKLRIKDVLKKILLAAGLGLVFGIFAALAFLISGNAFEDKETTPAETIVIEEKTTQAPKNEENPSEHSLEPAGDIWSEISPSVYSEIDSRLDEFASGEKLSQAKKTTVQLVNKSIVTITSTGESKDWFDKTISNNGSGFGLMVARTTGEAVFLTMYDTVKDRSSVYVKIGDNQIEASVKGIDKIFNMAAVSIPASKIADDSQLIPIAFGSSAPVSQGSDIILMGGPTGTEGSVLYGIVSYVDLTHEDTDALLRIFETNIVSVKTPEGFAVNQNGELVGWIRKPSEKNENYISLISISDAKTHIEKLCNGNPVPLLGISGRMVPGQQVSEGMPEGVYVAGVRQNTPAEKAGILPGDIITSIDSNEIKSFTDFNKIITSLEVNDRVQVTVSREYRGVYSSISLETELESR